MSAATATKKKSNKTKVAEGSKAQAPNVITGSAFRCETLSMSVDIESVTPYMCHQFGAKAKRQMLEGMMNPDTKKRATGAQREAKDPFKDFLEAGYWNFKRKGKEEVPVNLCVKANSIKNAICDAAAFLGDRKTLTKKDTKRAIFVEPILQLRGESLIPLTAEGPLPEGQKTRMDFDPLFEKRLKPFHDIGVSMDESLVKVGNGQPDLRYRPKLWSWTTTLLITFSRYEPDLVLTLLEEAGNGGIGENRPTSPQSTGEFGRFKITEHRDG